MVLTCYVPDKNKKNVLFCVDYIVKHSMEVNDWQGLFYKFIFSE